MADWSLRSEFLDLVIAVSRFPCSETIPAIPDDRDTTRAGAPP
jgi:hypothetical protein